MNLVLAVLIYFFLVVWICRKSRRVEAFTAPLRNSLRKLLSRRELIENTKVHQGAKKAAKWVLGIASDLIASVVFPLLEPKRLWKIWSGFTAVTFSVLLITRETYITRRNLIEISLGVYGYLSLEYFWGTFKYRKGIAWFLEKTTSKPEK
jgi:hypothetical protein